MAKLTDRQKRFVEEYLIDLNATQAAIRAGYSVKTAGQIGEQNLKKLEISEAIGKVMAERSKRTGINQDRIVNELAKLAFVKITDIIDDQCNIRRTVTDEDLACIESMKYKSSDSETGSSIEREVKIAPKLKALELLGKHLGMWRNKQEENAADRVEEWIEAVIAVEDSADG